MKPISDHYKIVIIGFGFGGLAAYRELLKYSNGILTEQDILIIDKNDSFLYSPLLHEASSGVLDYSDITIPIIDLIKRKTTFLKANVDLIKINQNSLSYVTEDNKNYPKELKYDYLIIATGSTTNFFDIKRAKDFCIELKSVYDIKAFHKFFRNLTKSKKYIINIVGGGPDGVELSTEISDRYGKQYDLEVNLFQSSDIILKEYTKKTQARAEVMLQKRGVNLYKNTKVIEIKENSVVLENGQEINSDLSIWVAGITTHPPKIEFLNDEENTAFEEILKGQNNRISVAPTLQMLYPNTEETQVPNIFVIGDISYLPNEKNSNLPYPMLAQVATRMGITSARNIKKIISKDKEQLEKFKYTIKGQLLAISRYNAGGNFLNLEISGFFGWIFWKIFYLISMPSYKKKILILKKWITTRHLFS